MGMFFNKDDDFDRDAEYDFDHGLSHKRHDGFGSKPEDWDKGLNHKEYDGFGPNPEDWDKNIAGSGGRFDKD